MNRLCIRALLLAPLFTGCTADFFVGPEDGSNASTDTDDSGQPPTTTVAPPTTGDGTSTTQSGTTEDPDLTTSSSTDETTTAVETTEDTEGTELTGDPTGDPTGESEGSGDCDAEDGPACEEAFPSCLWNGEACTSNPCNAEGGEKGCLAEAPECIWDGGGCIPSGCGDEAECSVLEAGVCEKSKGCVLVGESCFTPSCVPCSQIEDSLACNELPNCDYSEGREACLPQ